MCGITAFIGTKSALGVLLNGLQRLEYRGYDSAGVAVIDANGDSHKLTIVKKAGKVANLRSACDSLQASSGDAASTGAGTTGGVLGGVVGIAHTRWATHGAPNDVNAHPHVSGNGKIALVHNGIIENYTALKSLLTSKGFTFKSETDTEVLVQLIQYEMDTDPSLPPSQAVRQALAAVEGAFGCAIVFEDHPNLLIGMRRGSPLLLGIVEDGTYVLASDASAVVEHTQSVVYLEEDQMVCATPMGYEITSVHLDDTTPKPARVVELEMTLDAIEKGGHKHFMLKEILEQPKVLADAMRGRLDVPGAKVHLSGLEEHVDRVMAARRIVIAACGTSYHSGLVGEYLIETLARLPVEVEYASEFRYRDPILGPEDILVVISQSGETADTLAAVKLAKEKGALTFGLVNVVGSTIARETDCGAYLHVGPEIGVASTKAFTGQVVLLTCLALYLAKAKGSMSDERIREAMTALQAVPEQVAAVLEQKGAVYELCKGFRFASSFLYMGRGFNFPVALEGALKLKEISYIHAEGYAAAEMKHGPIALIDKMMPVVFLAPMRDHCYDKVRSNVQEVLARGGSVIVVTEEGNHDFDDMVDAVLYIPATPEFLSPLLTVIPLQLMSYYIADFRKCSIDQPRNLAKSVTVE